MSNITNCQCQIQNFKYINNNGVCLCRSVICFLLLNNFISVSFGKYQVTGVSKLSSTSKACDSKMSADKLSFMLENGLDLRYVNKNNQYISDEYYCSGFN